MSIEEFLYDVDYDTLEEKFVENFDVNHLVLDLMEKLELDVLQQFMIDKFIEEFSEDNIKEIFEE